MFVIELAYREIIISMNCIYMKVVEKDICVTNLHPFFPYKPAKKLTKKQLTLILVEVIIW